MIFKLSSVFKRIYYLDYCWDGSEKSVLFLWEVRIWAFNPTLKRQVRKVLVSQVLTHTPVRASQEFRGSSNKLREGYQHDSSLKKSLSKQRTWEVRGWSDMIFKSLQMVLSTGRRGLMRNLRILQWLKKGRHAIKKLRRGDFARGPISKTWPTLQTFLSYADDLRCVCKVTDTSGTLWTFQGQDFLIHVYMQSNKHNYPNLIEGAKNSAKVILLVGLKNKSRKTVKKRHK